MLLLLLFCLTYLVLYCLTQNRLKIQETMTPCCTHQWKLSILCDFISFAPYSTLCLLARLRYSNRTVVTNLVDINHIFNENIIYLPDQVPLSVFISCTFTPASLAQTRRSALHFIEWIGPSPSRRTYKIGIQGNAH
jgi:hypothetical protein